jgi:hypothetical protein
MKTSWKIRTAMNAKRCCSDYCCMQYQKTDFQLVRGHYWVEDQEKKDSYIKGIIGQREPDSAYVKFKYTVLGKECCSVAIQRLLGVSKTLFQKWVKVVVHQHYLAGLRSNAWVARTHVGNKKRNLVGWLDVYTGLRGTWGDWQPHKQELHLAYCQQGQIYIAYRADMILQGQETCSQQYFCKQFKEKFPHVKIHKWKNFAACDRCHHLYGLLGQTQDRERLKETRLLLEDHIEIVLREKMKYWKHIQKSRQKPSKYMCTILDGMDNKKTCCPHWIRIPHVFDHAWTMQFYLLGVLNHGHIPEAAAYVSPPGVKKGACLSIETLVRVLIKQKQDDGFVPRVWYIQADNASGEFKNSVCILFLAMLLQIGMFDKVCISSFILYNIVKLILHLIYLVTD